MRDLWLVYERCPECAEEDCLICRRIDREFNLHIVQSQTQPPNALMGPRTDKQEFVRYLGEMFGFDEDGRMYFHIRVERK